MDLHELKDRARSVGAPADAAGGRLTPGGSFEGLINALKAEDDLDRRRVRRAKTFFGIAAIVYLGLFTLTWILPPDGNAGTSRMALALFTVAFLGVWMKSRSVWRELSARDYSAAVETFVAQSERRYRFIDPSDVPFMVAGVVLLLLGAAAAWMSAGARYFPDLPQSTLLASFAVFVGAVLAASLAVGLTVTRAEWKKRKAPIWEELKRLKAELSREESERNGG